MITIYEHDDMELIYREHCWSRTLSQLFPPCLSSQGEELRWRDPRVEGSLDNSVSPLSITHRMCVILGVLTSQVSPLSWSLQSIPQLASYPQAGLVGIVLPRLANGLRRLGGVWSLPFGKSAISLKLGLWCKCSTTWSSRVITRKIDRK